MLTPPVPKHLKPYPECKHGDHANADVYQPVRMLLRRRFGMKNNSSVALLVHLLAGTVDVGTGARRQAWRPKGVIFAVIRLNAPAAAPHEKHLFPHANTSPLTRTV